MCDVQLMGAETNTPAGTTTVAPPTACWAGAAAHATALTKAGVLSVVPSPTPPNAVMERVAPRAGAGRISAPVAAVMTRRSMKRRHIIPCRLMGSIVTNTGCARPNIPGNSRCRGVRGPEHPRWPEFRCGVSSSTMGSRLRYCTFVAFWEPILGIGSGSDADCSRCNRILLFNPHLHERLISPPYGPRIAVIVGARASWFWSHIDVSQGS